MARAVGPRLLGATPAWESVAKLQELVESRSLATVAAACRDDRMAADAWETVFHAEMLSLLIWTLNKAHDAVDSANPIRARAPYVVSLLPSYGFALHAIRRAAPFSLVGLPTLVSVPADHVLELQLAVDVLRRELALGDRLMVASQGSLEIAKKASQEHAPIVFTGRRSVFDSIVKEHPDCQIFGATGAHSMVLGASCGSVREIIQRKKGEGLSRSCSNVGGWAVVDPASGVLQSHSSDLAGSNFDGTLLELIERDQPTVIFADASTASIVGASVAGYTVIPYHKNAMVSMVGFGRDPIGGWCGDYAM